MNATQLSPQTSAPTTGAPTGDRRPHPLQPLLDVNWLLVLALGAIGLIRPAIHVVEFMTNTTVWSWVPMAITVVITAVWVAIVVARRERRPFTTMLGVGVAYAVLTVVLGAVGGLLLMGGVQGPAAMPAAIPAVVLTNLVWGFVAGGLATLVLRMMGQRIDPWRMPRPATPAGQIAWKVLVVLLGAIAGFLLGIIATDVVMLTNSREAVTSDPLRGVVAALVPVLAVLGAALALPVHGRLSRRGDSETPATTR